MYYLSGHSLNSKVIFIIKTSVLLNGVLGKKKHFPSMGRQHALNIGCVFCAELRFPNDFQGDFWR